jgi:hypothetical protein
MADGFKPTLAMAFLRARAWMQKKGRKPLGPLVRPDHSTHMIESLPDPLILVVPHPLSGS